MRNKKESIRKFISYINNEEEYGGLWLPNIQRPFVWSREQIEKLFDSVMREYPVSTLLIWKTKADIRIRKFIDNYHDGIRLTDYYLPKNEKAKLIVLDGQQRLQSLYIALKGSYNGEELYFNVLSGGDDIDDIRYVFSFMQATKVTPERGWVKLKDLIFSNTDYYGLSQQVINYIGEDNLQDREREQVRKNISTIAREFRDRENIIYQELDSVDNPDLYSVDDVVEIFIRANSGGTPLGKSDLMFSLLTASWEGLEDELIDLLEDINRGGYEFSRDFILKTCLVLIDSGAKYDVAKFRKEENLVKIRNSWDAIKHAIKGVRDFVYGSVQLRNDKTLTSYLPLIPLIYLSYRFNGTWKRADRSQLSLWLLRMLLTGAFSGSSDSILDAVVRDIREKEGFDIASINSIIQSRGRSVYITPEKLLDSYYGDKQTFLIFGIWYRSHDFQPAFEGNIPTVDHIFPQSRLKRIRINDPAGGRTIIRYTQQDRDQIANLMLLSRNENSAEKRATLPEQYLAEQSQEYLKMHLIPDVPELWELDNFDEFITVRKKLIIGKFETEGLVRSSDAADFYRQVEGDAEKDPPVNFHDECVARVSEYMGVRLERKGRRTMYMSPDGAKRIVCLISHEYPDRSSGDYWFSLTRTHRRFLEEDTESHIAFGCGSADKIILIPYKRFSPLLDNMRTTKSADENSSDVFKWHVDIIEKKDLFFLGQSRSGNNVDISQYLLTIK
jgi:uncharacterized protein with ParB-like and HNH nuclease domain